jgi:hypothetical protein
LVTRIAWPFLRFGCRRNARDYLRRERQRSTPTTNGLKIPSLTIILTPRAGLRTQRAFFNAALALLGFVEGIYDVPDLWRGLIARG